MYAHVESTGHFRITMQFLFLRAFQLCSRNLPETAAPSPAQSPIQLARLCLARPSKSKTRSATTAGRPHRTTRATFSSPTCRSIRITSSFRHRFCFELAGRRRPILRTRDGQERPTVGEVVDGRQRHSRAIYWSPTQPFIPISTVELFNKLPLESQSSSLSRW